jgi:hypothetical protein
MRFICCALLTLALMNAPFALQADNPSDPADVVVVKFGWKAYTLRAGWDKEPDRTSIDAVRDDRRIEEERQRRRTKNYGEQEKQAPEHMPNIRRDPPVNNTKEYQYRATVKNAGAKTIKAVSWDYVIFDDERHEEIARQSFVSRKKIKPGETKELEEVSVSPPTHVVSAAGSGTRSGFTERIVINRVEYTAGPAWERQASKQP